MTSPERAWHVAQPVCDLYAQGALDPVIATSVEAHLTACADCRDQSRQAIWNTSDTAYLPRPFTAAQRTTLPKVLWLKPHDLK